ncbi:MAG: carbohydrate porin [Phycisphaeraceae bacterium]|nr:carbohydrate porin [Phycisphaeraceae bacterium]
MHKPLTMLVLLLALIQPALAQDQPLDNLLTRERLTGDWFGRHTQLESMGIQFDAQAIIDWSRNVRGGLDTEGEAWRALISLMATLDLTRLAGLPTGTVFVDFDYQDGQQGSDEVGDYQTVGSVDADGLTQISELWIEGIFLDDRLRLKVGKIDANGEFGYSELACLFVHGSASWPATDLLMPTYPDSAASANAFVKLCDNAEWGFGVYDGALLEGYRTGSLGPATFFGEPADLYLVSELKLYWILDAFGAGRAAVGGWHHTGTFARYRGGEQDGANGYHLILEQMLWSIPDNDGEPSLESRGLGLFFMYDWADPDVLDVEHHIEGGLTWRGLLPGRDNDVLGVMVSWIRFTDEPAAGFTDDSETAVELTYAAQVTPAVTVQPYMQWIAQPGGAGLEDAINLGVRAIVVF